jgi:outer membrane protein TolC
MSSTKAQTNMNPDSVLQSFLNNIEGDGLTLTQAREYAIKNATSVRNAEALYLAALGSLRRERGFFDPEFYLNAKYQDAQQPAASFFTGADVLSTKQTTLQTGLKLKLPIGTQIELSVNTIKLNTNSAFAFLNPEYDAFGSLTYRQPLLKGFLTSGRKDLSRVEFEYDAAKARYDQEVFKVISTVDQLYWNLYTSERDYAVQKLTRDRAEAFLKETELRNKAGLVGPNQTASSKTFLAEQELLLIDRMEQLDSQSDKLAVLIGLRPQQNRYKATDNPLMDFPIEPVDEIIEYTLKNNLELQASQKDLNAVQSAGDAADWEALPRLDIVGSIDSPGLGGDPRNVIFGTDTLRTLTNGSFGDALNQVFKRRYPGWSIGFEFSLPIGLRTGLGERDRIKATGMSYQQRYIELSRNLEQQVRTAHRELSNGNARLRAASNAVDAAQEQVRIGMIEFQNGRSTAFELVRLNEDYANAQLRYSEALVKTINAVATLRQLTSGAYPFKRN